MLIDHRSLEPSPDILKLHARCKKANREKKKKKKRQSQIRKILLEAFRLRLKSPTAMHSGLVCSD